ncbi:MAG TPA: lysophospholipid acyltransferase family protein [Pyrinomonadaceae bacterium]|nr:lysophospholipid acyltransferase family protein [Pyrinomonadaceae bacterium]
MSSEKEKVYRFAALAEYSFKQRLLIRAADLAFYFLIQLIGRTLRFEVAGLENVKQIEQSGKTPIYATWHNRIFPSVYYLRNRGIVVITSQSFDGEYIARFIRRFGFGAVRGSSTRGGAGALVKMIRLMRENLPMCFTIDGPKGARYVAKTGAILLAKKTTNPVLPFLIAPRKFWTINSWDKLQIPKPFTRAKVFFAEPIYVEKNAGEAQIENKRLELQRKLDEAVNFGEQWRQV